MVVLSGFSEHHITGKINIAIVSNSICKAFIEKMKSYLIQNHFNNHS